MFWIAKATGSGGTGPSDSFSFTSIPQTFTHLQLRATLRTTEPSVQDIIYIYNYNNNAGSTGSAIHRLFGNGSAVSSTNDRSYPYGMIGYAPGNNANANVYGSFILDILDYTNTNKNKTLRTISGYDNNGSGTVSLISTLPLTLPGTAAITSLTIICNSSITANSRFDLYGVTTSSATGA